MKDSLLFEKSKELCHKGLDIVEILISKNRYNFAKQLEKSVTSIAANIAEAQHPESKNDFIHKLKIALKESRETHFWLKLIEERNLAEIDSETYDLHNHVQCMLSKSIITAKKNDSKSNP
jgi:four helix bundle protein